MDPTTIKAIFMVIVLWDSGHVGTGPSIPFWSMEECDSHMETMNKFGFRNILYPSKIANGRVAKFQTHCIVVDQENMIEETIEKDEKEIEPDPFLEKVEILKI